MTWPQGQRNRHGVHIVGVLPEVVVIRFRQPIGASPSGHIRTDHPMVIGEGLGHTTKIIGDAREAVHANHSPVCDA